MSNWHHSGKQQLLTDLRLIAQGAAWMHGCGVELGPVPGLAAFVAASQDERTLQIRRRHMLLIYLLAFFVISIFVIYLFFTPVLPAGRVYDNILRAVCL